MSTTTSLKPKPFQRPGFISAIDQERALLGDFTLPDGTYVSLQRNLIDLLRSGGFVTSAVKDVNYDSPTNTLIITYTDATPTKNIVLNGETGKILVDITLDPVTHVITFTFDDGSTITLDLSTMMDSYYTKDEIDTKFSDLDTLNWKNF